MQIPYQILAPHGVSKGGYRGEGENVFRRSVTENRAAGILGLEGRISSGGYEMDDARRAQRTATQFSRVFFINPVFMRIEKEIKKKKILITIPPYFLR